MSRGGGAGSVGWGPVVGTDVLDALFDPHLVVVAERDDDGAVVDLRCIAANAPAAAAMAQPRDAIVGARLGAFLGHPAGGHLLPSLIEAIARGEPLALDGIPVVLGAAAESRRYDIRAVPTGDGLVLSWRDVTASWAEHRELLEAREALVASEEHYRLIAENATDIVTRSGPDGRLRWVSPSIREVLGHPPEALLGHSGLEFVHPDDLATMRSVVERIDDGEPGLAKLRFRHADGSHRWMLTSGRPIVDAEGTVVGRTSTLRDVTLEHLAMEALATSEERFRRMVDGLLDPMVMLTPIVDDGRVVDFVFDYVNPAACAYNRRSAEETVGRRLLELLPAHRETGVLEIYARVIETGEPALLDDLGYRDPVAHGDVARWTDTRAFRIEGSLVITWRDATVRHEARAALLESEARYRLLADSAVDVVTVGLPDTTLTWVSPSARTVMGWEPEDVVGRRVIDLLHPEDRAAWLARGVTTATTGAIVYEARFQHADGSYRWMSVATTMLRDGDGEPVARMAIARDISAEHAAREALEESRAELAALNESLEQRVRERTDELETFTYTLSHDLRAPLRWINGFAAMLQRRDGDRLDETSRHYLDEIRNASDRMGRLFEELLDYSRLGRQTVRADRLDWARIAAALRGTFAPRLAATGATLEIHEPLAPVLGDPMLLERALTNLVDNGLTYTRSGHPGAVTLRAIRVGDRVRVSVSDEGIGIPPDQQERIFQPFVRLHDADTYPGTGIGLAIVQRAIGLMGGAMRVDSVPGAGTTFWFELPAG
jgi:PAS domain S-box-containing protein